MTVDRYGPARSRRALECVTARRLLPAADPVVLWCSPLLWQNQPSILSGHGKYHHADPSMHPSQCLTAAVPASATTTPRPWGVRCSAMHSSPTPRSASSTGAATSWAMRASRPCAARCRSAPRRWPFWMWATTGQPGFARSALKGPICVQPLPGWVLPEQTVG